MYVTENFRTKKALKEAVAAAKDGKRDYPFATQVGPFPGRTDGKACIEGPHYPEPHKWYAEARFDALIHVRTRFRRNPARYHHHRCPRPKNTSASAVGVGVSSSLSSAIRSTGISHPPVSRR